jgi:hypothetical protein
MITYTFIGSLLSKGPTFYKNSYLLTWRTILFFRCECGNCSSMTTPEECICCVEVPAVHSQMLSEDMQCITDSDIFISNCLNRHVLHVSMYEFLENVCPFDDSEPINEYVIIFQHFIQYVRQWENIPSPNWLADQK